MFSSTFIPNFSNAILLLLFRFPQVTMNYILESKRQQTYLVLIYCGSFHQAVQLEFDNVGFYDYFANRSIVMWRFWGIDKSVRVNSQGNTFLCGWLTRHSMEILTLQHFWCVQTKQRFEHVSNSRNWRVTRRQSMETLTLQHFRFVQTKQCVRNRYIRNKT